MKYLWLTIALFIGYQYYVNATAPPPSSGNELIDQVRVAAVSKKALTDFVIEEQYQDCKSLTVSDDKHACMYKLHYNKPFCLKLYNLDAPKEFRSEDVLEEFIDSFTSCLFEHDVY